MTFFEYIYVFYNFFIEVLQVIKNDYVKLLNEYGGISENENENED